MKTILISDIENGSGSIVPYSLNFAKYLDDTVRILHILDPRKHHGVPSAYSDSQSFEIGRKLTQKEILERDKHHTRIKLDNLLSKEASKLNYPLRVKTIIEEDNIENRLNHEIRNEPLSFVISSSAFNGTVFHDASEFLEVTNRMNSLSLIVPPGYKVSTPKKLFVLFNFDSENSEGIFKMLKCMQPFKMSVSVANVSKSRKYLDLILVSEAWKQEANIYLGPLIPITTYILVGKQFMETAINFIQRNNYDLVAIPHNIKRLTAKNNFKGASSAQLITNLNLPVLLY